MRPAVLIADTDKDSRAELTAALLEFDVDVLLAEDAEAGLRHFIERGPVLVLIDVFLPRRGGVDFLRRLRAAEGGRDVSAMILCGVKGLSDLRDEALGELDARAFLTKPLRRESLKKYFEAVLSRPGDKCFAAPQGLFPSDMPPAKGELEKYPFAMLFKQLCQNRYTGTLAVAFDKDQKVIYFQDGSVVFAHSNRVAETLGRHMLAEGVISQEVYAEALDRLQSTGTKFGSILKELGHFDQEGVDRAVKSHIIAKVVNVFGWPGGRFVLGSGEPPPGAVPPGDIDYRQILWKGIIASVSMGDVFSLVKDSLHLYVAAKRDPAGLLGEFDLQENDRLFLDAARGLPGKTMRQVLSATGAEREMRLLLGLFALDVLVLCESPDCNYVASDPEEEALRRIQAVRQTLMGMKSKNHFQVLGVPIDADDHAIRRSYQDKVKEFHPDTLAASAPEELKRLYSEVFLLLRTAFEGLEKADDRKSYLASLKNGVDSTFTEGAKLLDAETSFQRGMSFYRKRNWGEALPHLEEALKLNPDEAEYQVSVGVAKMHLKDGDREKNLEEAKKHLQRAADLDYRSGEPYYRLGLLYKILSNGPKALECFQRALVRDPTHMQARLELRLLGSRKERGAKPNLPGRKVSK